MTSQDLLKILATAPATADLIKGDMFFALDTGILTVCTVTGSTLLSIQLV